MIGNFSSQTALNVSAKRYSGNFLSNGSVQVNEVLTKNTID